MDLAPDFMAINVITVVTFNDIVKLKIMVFAFMYFTDFR